MYLTFKATKYIITTKNHLRFWVAH